MADDDLLRATFATDNLWKTSSLFEDPTEYECTLFAPLEFNIATIKLDNPYAPKNSLDLELRLPDLDTFEFGPLPELESLDLSTPSVVSERQDADDKIWQIAFDLGPADKDIVFFTWEGFDNPDQIENRSSYISETGTEGFDGALQKQAEDGKKQPAGRVLGPNILLDCLINLGLGRSSILFKFDPKKKTFVQAVHDGKTFGLSLTTAQSFIQQFIATGNTFLWLRAFVENTFASSGSISARVALATSISAILSTFENHLGKQVRKVKSFLQLQRLFEKPQAILYHLARMVDAVKSVKTNEQLSSTLYRRIQAIEENDGDFLRLSQQVLCFVARPSLELVAEWIGTSEDNNKMPFETRNSFVAVEVNDDSQGPAEYVYNSEMMPQFISEEDGRLIFETGNSLRFIKTRHPDHPLASLTKAGIEAPNLEWRFGWEHIQTIAAKAKAYEDGLRTAIREFSTGFQSNSKTSHKIPSSQIDSPKSQSDFEQYIEDCKAVFNEPPKSNSRVLPDELYTLLDRMLLDESKTSTDVPFSPPLSITPIFSFHPVLAAQAALVNAVTLRLFFRSHQLRLHLSVQRQYHLLGDGVFSSRLASSLFDPELETAERRKGTIRSGVHMGLQLGARSTWPPASSELRLALMGVLSESYYSSALYLSTITKEPLSDQSGETQTRRVTDELPGQLNFAIRQLTEREMERIMDPDSLYALDFLRLQYVPPSPLNLVITSGALEKYDYIFKFLLRLLRMLFVVSHLPRQYSDAESRRFRNEAHHFITVISSYVFYTGISENWQHFESFVDSVEARIQEEDATGELGTKVKQGLDSIKAAHEHCLDSIMFSLLLRRRQKKVMTLLEEIFEHILTFSKRSNGRTGSEKEFEEQEPIYELYARFKGKLRVFISVCRGLTGKRGYGKGEGSSEENRMERLLVLLEMNGYYGV